MAHVHPNIAIKFLTAAAALLLTTALSCPSLAYDAPGARVTGAVDAATTSEAGIRDFSGSVSSLESILRGIADAADARVGVALIMEGKDTLTIGNDSRYPLMSVMKLHQAVATARLLELGGQTLDKKIQISAEMLLPDTWSPLRDKYPEGGISMSVRDLLRYTLQQSDNNACDILFGQFGRPSGTDSLLRSMGIKDFVICATEDEMHKDLGKCHDNWSTPLSAALLMDNLAAGTLGISEENSAFIRQTLTECRTGLNRLPLPLKGTGALIGHKTGTSDQGKDGRWIGINDVGFILLPDGKRYTLAVFVADSALSMEETEKIIADMSAAVYGWISGGRGLREPE